MRIAFVCADRGVPVFGAKGSSVHAQEIIRALRACATDLHVFAAHVGGDAPPGLESVPVHLLPSLPREPAAWEQAALAANRDLRAALEHNGPFDLVYERYALWSFAGMEYARAAGTPGVLEVNAPLVEEQAAYRGLVDRAAAEAVADRVFAAASVLIAVSDEMAAYLERYPRARGRIHVVPNGVNPCRFTPGRRPACPAPVGTFTVGFVGTLKPWHGLPILVEAFAMLHRRAPATRLLIVGDGPERPHLEADLSARGLGEAVKFTNVVAPAEVPGLLASMDTGVAPYPDHPHFYFSPMKVYEYMAAGLPVVASRIGQLAVLLRDGDNGLLCPPGDRPALASALDRLRLDPELRVRLGRAGRATVLRDHTWEQVARRTLRLANLPAGRRGRFVQAGAQVTPMTVRRIAYVLRVFPKISETFIAGELAELRRRDVEVRILSLFPAGEELHHQIVARADLMKRTIYDSRLFSSALKAFGPEVLHAHFATDATAAARDLAAEIGVPFTFTAHGYDIYRRPPEDFADRAAAASAVITVSEANARHIVNTFGVPASRLHVIACGVNTEQFRPQGERAEPPLIVCVARLVPVKNLELLLDACARLRERGVKFRCVLIGDGRSRDEIAAARVRRGLTDVLDLVGAAEQSEVLAWWRRASVAALTSQSEGMPVSLMEAAACGVPAVATAVGGVPELVEDGVTGILTPPGDAQALAAALEEVLRNRELAARLGAAARRRAEERFSVVRQVDRLLALWTSLICEAANKVSSGSATITRSATGSPLRSGPPASGQTARMASRSPRPSASYDSEWGL